MNIKHYLMPLTLLGLFSTGTRAEITVEHELRYYDVEVVIFKNDLGPKSQEYILPVASPRQDDEILDLSSPLSIEAAKEKSFEMIPYDELRLTQAVISIVNSSRFSLLAHTGWRQPGLEKSEAMPIWIKGGRLYGDEYTSIDSQIDSELITNNELFNLGEPADLTAAGELGSAQASPDPNLANQSIIPTPDQNQLATDLTNADQTGPDNTAAGKSSMLYELEGKITVSLARYLHTAVDLVLRKPRLSIDDPALAEIEVGQLAEEIQSDTRILDNYNMKESRRMRSNKLHYIDSPEFSMLVLITPYELPEDAEIPAPGLVEESIETVGSNAIQ